MHYEYHDTDEYLRIDSVENGTICVSIVRLPEGTVVGHSITTEDRCGNTETTTVEVGPSTITGYIGSTTDTTISNKFDELCAQFENLRTGGLAVVAKKEYIHYL